VVLFALLKRQQECQRDRGAVRFIEKKEIKGRDAGHNKKNAEESRSRSDGLSLEHRADP
jgi:hypothetical protein